MTHSVPYDVTSALGYACSGWLGLAYKIKPSSTSVPQLVLLQPPLLAQLLSVSFVPFVARVCVLVLLLLLTFGCDS